MGLCFWDVAARSVRRYPTLIEGFRAQFSRTKVLVAAAEGGKIAAPIGNFPAGRVAGWELLKDKPLHTAVLVNDKNLFPAGRFVSDKRPFHFVGSHGAYSDANYLPQ